MKDSGMFMSTIRLSGYGNTFMLYHKQPDALTEQAIETLFAEWLAELGDRALETLGLVKADVDAMTPSDRKVHFRSAKIDRFADWLCEHREYTRIDQASHVILEPNALQWLEAQYTDADVVNASLVGIWTPSMSGTLYVTFAANVIEGDIWNGSVNFNLIVAGNSIEVQYVDWHDSDIDNVELSAETAFQKAFGRNAAWSKEDLFEIVEYAYEKGFEYVRTALAANTLPEKFRTLRIFNAVPAEPY